MPSRSAKQARFMQAAAHSPEFARKAGIKQSVAQEFHAADQRTGLHSITVASRQQGKTAAQRAAKPRARS